MPLPDYIDNSQHSLETILSEIILKENQTTLDIATGFFRIEAWMRLEKPLNNLTTLRLLIGRDPTILPAERDRLDLLRYFRRDLQTQLETEPFNFAYKQQLDRLITYLEQAHIHARLYGANVADTPFLHAKAYIFDNYSIVGSSNFTPSGLNGNTELNLLNKIDAIARDLRTNWFEKFWNDPSADLDYKTKLIEVLNASKFGSKPYTPYQVFIKALYELFQEEEQLTPAMTIGSAIELANFQHEGFERAVRLIERHNACIVADAVGLGKTFIGLRLLDHYLIKDRRPGHVPRALIVCPAQLRDLVWSRKLDDFGIKANIISQEELGRKTFDTRKYSNYDIIIVDESHNFRNSNTNRYQNLQKILSSGKRNKRIALLTATPINNTIFDLYHQVLLLTRNSDTYYREWGISNLKTYFKALDKGKVEIIELLMQTMVRRSRQDVIKRQQAGEPILISGKEIHFPTRQLEKFTYDFESSFQGLYAGIAQQIDQLTLSPYNIRSFKKRPNSDDITQVKKNEALVALMKSLYLKRLESSLIAFENSITAQRNFQTEFEGCLHDGKLLTSKTFRKIIAAETDEEESISIPDLINSLEIADRKDYDTDQLGKNISADFQILENILSKLQQVRNLSKKDHDLKLVAFKNLLLQFKGKKVIVFSYFKDTAIYVEKQLREDAQWLADMGLTDRTSHIDLITGETNTKDRAIKVQRFAPKANCQYPEDIPDRLANPIDILICTDVLSEGQNLQDAGILINYDLHWNPVRMIQRAGRIDRLGTEFNELLIYNCFPEQGLEALLGLVTRLQQRIATIDREVGLDGSVLGEMVSDRSIEEIRRLKEADTQDEKIAILQELEQVSELASLDEMRFPLINFNHKMGRDAADEIPLGIHSTRTDGPKDVDGLFLAFRTRNRSFWHFYPRMSDGHISPDPNDLIKKQGTIFQWLKCEESDYPDPETLPPAKFDNAIFPILKGAIRNLLQELNRQQSGTRLRPTLSKLLQKVQTALTQQDLLNAAPIDEQTKERVLHTITSAPLKNHEKSIRSIWDKFTESKNIDELITELDELFNDQQLYQAIEDNEPSSLKIIEDHEIQLVCYQWFKPTPEE
jgi:superfamily II DNA or RNA helicase